MSRLSRGESKYSMPALRSRVTTQSQSRCSSRMLSAFSGRIVVRSTGAPCSASPVVVFEAIQGQRHPGRWVGSPPPSATCRATASTIFWPRRSSRSVCPRSDGCFSPPPDRGTTLRHEGVGAAAKSRSKNDSKPNARNGTVGATPVSISTRDSNVSNATARWAAVCGSPASLRAHRSRGSATPPGRLMDSSIHRSSVARTPAPLRRFSRASEMNRPAMARCSGDGYRSSEKAGAAAASTSAASAASLSESLSAPP